MIKRKFSTALLAPLLLFVSLSVFAQTQPRTVTVTAASYTDNARNGVYAMDATANAQTLTLVAPAKARRVIVVKTDSSVNAVTISTAGTGATINGATSFVLRSQWDAVTFVANGRTGSNGVWYATAANRRISLPVSDKTVATTSTTEWDLIAPETGILVGATFSGTDALSANDSNYITFSITNLGQAGAGSTAMLAATDANTTKSTGGAALAAGTKRLLTLNGTAANLLVAHGDRLRIRATATGTLANTVTFSTFLLRFAAQ